MKSKRGNQSCDCFNCGNCMYLGDGDYLCDAETAIVVSDFIPSEDFLCCGGKRYVEDV